MGFFFVRKKYKPTKVTPATLSDPQIKRQVREPVTFDFVRTHRPHGTHVSGGPHYPAVTIEINIYSAVINIYIPEQGPRERCEMSED